MIEQGPLSDFGQSQIDEYEQRRETRGTTLSDRVRYHVWMLLSMIEIACVVGVITGLVLLVSIPVHGDYWLALRNLLSSIAIGAGALLLKTRIKRSWWWFDE